MCSQQDRMQDGREFEATLGALIRAAEANDVDVKDVYDVESSGDDYYWMVEISRIRRRDPLDDRFRDVP